VSNALRQVSCILKVLREKTNEDYGFFINKTLLEKHNILYIHLPITPRDILYIKRKIRKTYRSSFLKNVKNTDFGGKTIREIVIDLVRKLLTSSCSLFKDISLVPKNSSINIKFGYIDRKQKSYYHNSFTRRFNRKMVKIDPDLIF